MSDHTPQFTQPELPFDDETEYASWVAMFGLRAPYGECQCGCGELASLAKLTNKKDGHAAGKPVRYLPYHHLITAESSAEFAPWVATYGLTMPYGECQCGCGESTTVALVTWIPQGHLKGHPKRFVLNHDKRRQPLDTFWSNVDKRAPDECWEWQGCRDGRGYGAVTDRGVQLGTHRVSWELTNGPIPDGLWVLHKCDNPPCVNPNHLFLGTHADNIADRDRKGRQAKGSKGGSAKLTEANVIEIWALIRQGVMQKDIAAMFGVKRMAVGRITRGITWIHIKEPHDG